MNLPDEEVLADARAAKHLNAGWPDPDRRFGCSSPATEKAIALPPGFQLDERAPEGSFALRKQKAAEAQRKCYAKRKRQQRKKAA